MDLTTVPLWVAGITAFGVASAPLATVFNTWWADRRATKVAAKVEEARTALLASNVGVDAKLTVIHELVNSRLSKALDKIAELELLLKEVTGRVPRGEPD